MTTYDDCVDKKVEKLVSEGKERDQAVAIAKDMCQEDEKSLETKMVMRPSQAETGYTPLSAESGKACANCRFYDGDMQMCALIENYPDSILPTGYCSRWETPPNTEAVVVSATPAPEEMMEGDSKAVPLTVPIPEISKQTSLIAHVKALVGDMLHKRVNPEPSGFKTFGNHWVGWWTNNAQDRDQEWFPTKAIDAFVDRVDVGMVPQPTLWFWHIPGSRHGIAEWQGRIDHYCVAVGSFDDTAVGKAARDHYQHSKSRYGMSHGFVFDPSQYQDGAYHQFNTFELSVLPPQVAANPYTDFEGIKQMALTPDKIQALEKLVGKENAQQIIAETEAKNKALDELKVQFKEWVEVKPTEAPASKEAVEQIEQNVSTLIVDMLSDQAAMVQLVDAMGKAMQAREQAHTSTVEGLKAEIKALQDVVNTRPRVASKDEGTVVTESKIDATIIAQMKETGSDSFWTGALQS